MTERPGAKAEALAAAIHASPRRGVFAVTGGGAGLLADLLTAPGASATVLEATVPYAATALREALGTAPAQACSEATARALAMRSFQRARALGGDFGFAIAAALATTRARRGDDRAHFAFQDAAHTRAWRLPLAKDESRPAQERGVAAAGLGALAFALGVGPAPRLAATSAGGGACADVVHGTRSHVGATQCAGVLPGAFNPRHEGHDAMRADAARRLGGPVAFELSVANVDKPPLDYIALERRLAQFAPDEVVVTHAPTFAAKACIFGGVAFVVGVDTLARIAAARYYGGVGRRTQAFAELRMLGCTFLVYGRAEGGVFQTFDDLEPVLPASLASLCVGVPESAFRVDVSSTALRAARAE